jgi:hypothetical protein
LIPTPYKRPVYCGGSGVSTTQTWFGHASRLTGCALQDSSLDILFASLASLYDPIAYTTASRPIRIPGRHFRASVMLEYSKSVLLGLDKIDSGDEDTSVASYTGGCSTTKDAGAAGGRVSKGITSVTAYGH